MPADVIAANVSTGNIPGQATAATPFTSRKKNHNHDPFEGVMLNSSDRIHTPRRAGLRGPLTISATVTGVLLQSAGFAADGPGDPAAGTLEEVTVTATFREARLQDTPVAITAVTAEMLEQRSQSNVFEIARQAPNVTLAPQGQGYGSTMLAFIRGVGQNDFAFALEPGVGIYVDDVYYSTLTGSLLDLLDIDRVEVLRGPSRFSPKSPPAAAAARPR
jgi:outer membrane receptor protein involved in Fe transport